MRKNSQIKFYKNYNFFFMGEKDHDFVIGLLFNYLIFLKKKNHFNFRVIFINIP